MLCQVEKAVGKAGRAQLGRNRAGRPFGSLWPRLGLCPDPPLRTRHEPGDVRPVHHPTIAELGEQILQDPPIALAGGEAKRAFEMVLQILLDRVVVEQRVVDVDEEDGWMVWMTRRPQSST
jgi:hypothetical protein